MQERKMTAQDSAEELVSGHKGEISLRSGKRPLAMRQEQRKKSCVLGWWAGMDFIFSTKVKARAFVESCQEWARSISYVGFWL